MAAQNLNINTPSLLNDRGLIFSGNDMTLSVGNLTNQNGDFYGLGNVTIKGYGTAQASQVSNLSGSMESGKTFKIDAANFANRTSGDDGTQNFALNRKLVSGFIGVQCGDCSGGTYDVNLIAREVFEGGQDNDTTASSLLTAGGDFIFNGGEFLNSKSTLSASGNITINANNMRNVGAVSGSIERTRIYRSGAIDLVLSTSSCRRWWRTTSAIILIFRMSITLTVRGILPRVSFHRQRAGRRVMTAARQSGCDQGLGDEQVCQRSHPVSGIRWGNTSPQSQYDRNNLVEMPTGLQSFTLASDIEAACDGTVTVRAQCRHSGRWQCFDHCHPDLQNSVIHEGLRLQRRHQQSRRHQGKRYRHHGHPLNSQLPPDLAQQQVNPLTLPGFPFQPGKRPVSSESSGRQRLCAGWSHTSSAGLDRGRQNVVTQEHMVAATIGGPRNLSCRHPDGRLQQ